MSRCCCFLYFLCFLVESMMWVELEGSIYLRGLAVVSMLTCCEAGVTAF